MTLITNTMQFYIFPCKNSRPLFSGNLNSQSTVFVQKRPVLAYKRRRQGPREQVKLKRLSDFIVYKQVVNYFD